MHVKRISTIIIILVIIIISFVEIGFITNIKDQWEHESASRWFLITSVGIGFLTLLVGSIGVQVNLVKIKSPKLSDLVLVLILVIACLEPIRLIFDKFAFSNIDATQSDIIPQIQTMVRWTLQGVYPYQPIVDWGYNLFPTYLPLTWMPFIIPEVLEFDYRIFALVIFFAGVYFLFHREHKNLPGNLIAAIFIYYLIRKIALFEDTIIGYSVEAMIAGFYLIFAATWKSDNKWTIAIGLLLCLLSRYALVIWLLVFFTYLWRFKGIKFSFQTGLITFAGILLLYIIPFLSQDTSIYSQGMQHHSKAAINEWKGQPWQKDQSRPYSLYKGIGMTNRFFEHPQLTIPERLQRLQKFHLSLLIGSCILFSLLLFYFFYRLADPTLFLLGTFKIYIALFYHFIQIPYTYLYLTLLIISVPIMMQLMSRFIAQQNHPS